MKIDTPIYFSGNGLSGIQKVLSLHYILHTVNYFETAVSDCKGTIEKAVVNAIGTMEIDDMDKQINTALNAFYNLVNCISDNYLMVVNGMDGINISDVEIEKEYSEIDD